MEQTIGEIFKFEDDKLQNLSGEVWWKSAVEWYRAVKNEKYSTLAEVHKHWLEQMKIRYAKEAPAYVSKEAPKKVKKKK